MITWLIGLGGIVARDHILAHPTLLQVDNILHVQLILDARQLVHLVTQHDRLFVVVELDQKLGHVARDAHDLAWRVAELVVRVQSHDGISFLLKMNRNSQIKKNLFKI